MFFLNSHLDCFISRMILLQGLHSEVPGVVKWLQSEQGNERLLELSRCLVLHVGQDAALCAEDRKTVWKIIKLCIVTERHGQCCFSSFSEMKNILFSKQIYSIGQCKYVQPTQLSSMANKRSRIRQGRNYVCLSICL